MIDREKLVAWASTPPDDFVKCAVRDAEHKAIDNPDGQDERAMFYDALFANLGGKRAKGRPQKDIDAGPIALTIVVQSGRLSERKIATKLAEIYAVAPNTIRARVGVAAKKMAEGQSLLGPGLITTT